MPRQFLPPLGAAVFATITIGAFVFSPHRAPPPPSQAAAAALSATSTTTPTLTTSSTTDAVVAPQVTPAADLTPVSPSASEPKLPPPVSNEVLTAAGAKLLDATVNILCIARRTSGFESISGSGVIIDPRGLILTAAHIGQYFLLADAKPSSITCTIRTGAPAHDSYFAKVAYVSPSWIQDNAKNLSETSPKGTGENDFAILAITSSAVHARLPETYPYVPLSHDTVIIGEKLAISGYAAQYLHGGQIEYSLYPTIVFDSVSNRYTFDTNTVDVLSVAGTAAAQEGSSGGGMVDAQDGLVGLITTSSIKGDISDHILNAITALHIRTSFAADGGANFDSYFADSSPSTLVNNFTVEAHKLEKILLEAN